MRQELAYEEALPVNKRILLRPSDPQSAMNPSIKHRIKGCVFHGIKICLHHFPKEVEEEGQVAEADFPVSEKDEKPHLP